MYSIKVYEDDVIFRNCIPCYKTIENSDEIKPGLYDLVEGRFYTNQGTGNDFDVGENVY